jgi:dihydroorotase
MMRFDLLVKGGEVVDPEAGFSGKMDVAVSRGRIAAVDKEIPAETAARVIDASGQVVTPGLIDFHAHVYEGVTYWGVNADAIGSQSGVTTWVDAGSPGAVTLPGFRKYIVDASKVKIFAFLNIAYIGLVAQDYELVVSELSNVEILEKVANLNRDILVGIKLRAGRSGGAQGLEAYERSRMAADHLDLPLMVHISTAPPNLETTLGYLQPGDIITHCYTGQSMKLIDDEGKLLPFAKKALDEGVIMDMGHGAGSFSFVTAEAMIAQSYWLNVISTDLHHMSLVGHNLVDPLKGSAFGDLSETNDARSVIVNARENAKPVFNLLTCMDKMLLLGMPFDEVIKATTSKPAELLGMKGEIGTLKPGAIADIATFVIEEGNFEYYDIHGEVRKGTQSVRNVLTILDGRPFERIPIPPPPPWVEGVD